MYTVVRFFFEDNQTYIVSPDCLTPGHCTLVKLEARGTVFDGNVGRNLSDCPSLQGTQCRGVPSSLSFLERRPPSCMFCGEGILSSPAAFIPVG